MSKTIPHKCPVCFGCGKMPREFYPDLRDFGNTAMWKPYVNCRSCWGTGLVYESTDEEIPGAVYPEGTTFHWPIYLGSTLYDPNWVYIYPFQRLTYYESNPSGIFDPLPSKSNP